MEKMFFTDRENDGDFIIGNKPCVFDFALYHELLNAMIIAGIGKSTQMFTEDQRFRMHKIRSLDKWYFKMGQIVINRRLVKEFLDDMKKGSK